jgi:ABC-type transport system substrate-binding protein
MLTSAVIWLPDPAQNFTGINSPRYKELIDAARTSLDLEKRKSALREINDIILTECFALPITPSFVSYVKTKNVQGFEANLDGMPFYDQIWLS